MASFAYDADGVRVKARVNRPHSILVAQRSPGQHGGDDLSAGSEEGGTALQGVGRDAIHIGHDADELLVHGAT